MNATRNAVGALLLCGVLLPGVASAQQDPPPPPARQRRLQIFDSARRCGISSGCSAPSES